MKAAPLLCCACDHEVQLDWQDAVAAVATDSAAVDAAAAVGIAAAVDAVAGTVAGIVDAAVVRLWDQPPLAGMQ